MSRNRLSQDYINWTLTLNVSQVQEEIHKLEKENKDLQAQTSATRKAMAKLEAEGKKGSTEWKNLRNSISEYNRSISENKDKISQLTKCMNLGDMTANQLQKRLRHLQAEFRNTSKAQQPEKWKELSQQVNACKEALAEASKPAQTLWEKFKNLTSVQEILKGGLWSIGEKIIDVVTGAFKKAATTIMDFESSNARLAAILGTNIDGISSLTEQAKLLGRTTTATASDVTSLQTELAKLGFSTDAIEAMTPAVLKFSQAVGADLGSASAFAGAALRIFGKDAADTEEVLASFAVATTKSSLDFSKLETALSTAGPVAAAFGMSIEDTTALLGQLANAGFDASSAATATRNILLNMADSSGNLAKALGKPVSNLDELVAGLKKLNSEGIDLAKALDLTDKSSVAAFQSFLAGTDAMIELRDGITGCTDGFNDMTDTMTDSADAAWAGLESAIEGLVLKFFAFREVLKGLFNGASEVVTWLGDMIDMFAPLGRIVMAVVGAFGALLSLLGKGIKFISDLVKESTGFKVVLNSLVVAVIAYRAASMKAVESVKGWAAAIKSWVIAARTKITTTYADIQGTNLATKATHLFNAALKANPIGLVVGLLAALVAGIVAYCSALDKTEKKTEELDEATKRYNDAMADAGVKYETQKDKIDKLVKIQNDETLAKEQRIRAINELNRIIPGYNAQLDAETGKVRANTQALKDYLKQLKKKLELEANQNAYKDLIEEESKVKRDQYTKWKNSQDNPNSKKMDSIWDTMAKNGTEGQKAMGNTMRNVNTQFKNMSFEDYFESLNIPETQKRKGFEKYLNETDTDLSELNSTPAAGGSPEGGDKKPGKGSGSQPPKKDPIKEATAAADKLHGENMLSLEQLKDDLADSDYVIRKNKEIIRYCNDLDGALTALKKKTAATNKDLINKIEDRQNKIAGDALKAQSEINAARTRQAADAHKTYMEVLQEGVDEQNDIIEVALRKQTITEGQADLMRLRNQKDLHADQMAELRRYYSEVEQADYMSENDRRQALDSISGDIRKMQSQILTDTGNWAARLRSMMENPESFGSIARSYEMQCKDIEATYDTMIGMVEAGSDQAVALEAEKNRRLAALNYQYQEQQWALRENAGLSWNDEYERQLNQLKSMHARALIDEKGFQKKKLELQVNSAKQYYDYYSGLSSSMFTAIQNAEIATSDAKYDVLIQQAKNNGEDTAALEEEKENKKLEIQKKYADVDFAIKISQIIADTSVSIMKAFSQLGPIGGAVAAAMLTATGVAQVVSAKAERDKIKNMEPGRTAASSPEETATKTRVLTGYSDGGYTGDGRRLEVAGIVHKGEYVVPMPIMKDPRVIDAVGLIESIRQQRMLGRPATAASGGSFAQGGYTSAPAIDFSEFREGVAEMRSMLQNIRAYVVYRDIEQAREKLDRARAPFTRKG